jgi:hypothetical protein
MRQTADNGEARIAKCGRRNLLRLAAVAMVAASVLMAALAGCKNAIADEVESLQAEAVSPVISVLTSKATVEDGGSIAFGAVSTTSYGDFSLAITNKGKKDLVINVSGIALSPDSSTADGVFALCASPAPTVSSSGSTTLKIRFTPGSEGSKSAILTIPTNDVQTPSYKCTLTGTGWAVALSAAEVLSYTYTTASIGGSITSAGSSTITERGICWSTSPDPTISDGKRADAGTGTGSFTCALSGLLPGTYYYVRAYASSGANTVYGLSASFTTTAATAPTTATVAAINATSATAGCTAIADTGVTVSECGICWSASSGPTTAGSHLSGTSGGSIALSGLSLATTYYVRAYAVLYSGSASVTTTVYGGEKSFKTVGYKDGDGFYVFYDAGSVQTDATSGNWRYMVAAPSDMGTSNWSNLDGTLLGATATAIGTGRSNTAIIVTALGSYSVSALACTTATFTDYPAHTDWYLPSKDELNLMIINLAQNALGGFTSNNTLFYWSSSEVDKYQVYIQSLTMASGNSKLRKESIAGLTRAARRVTVLP